MIVGVIPSSFPTWLISWRYSWKKQHETCKEVLTQGEAGLHSKDESIHGCVVGKEPPQKPGAAPLMIKPRGKGWPCTFSFLQLPCPQLRMLAFEQGGLQNLVESALEFLGHRKNKLQASLASPCGSDTLPSQLGASSSRRRATNLKEDVCVHLIARCIHNAGS